MMPPLDAARIDRSIDGIWRERMDSLQVFAQVESTNDYLMRQSMPGPGRFRVAVADSQTHGRGRRGRTWVSPESTGVCLSLSWRFARLPENVAGLTIACGTAVAACIEKLGQVRVGLKWPNDIVVGDAKLGGILTESRNSAAVVVIGIGINVDLADSLEAVQQVAGSRGVSDLSACLGFVPPRDALCGSLVNWLCEAVRDYELSGMDAFAASWATYDTLRGRRVTVEIDGQKTEGIADGIDASGALRVSTTQGVRLVVNGSVTASTDIGSAA